MDCSTPAAAEGWWSAHGGLVRAGVAGWWLDGGERPPAAAALHRGEGRLLHNLYDRLRHEAFAAGEATARPDQRVFLLCRSGAAGMQRFGATTGTGDVNNDFRTLEAQVPIGLNTGLSGVPYWGSDVGGFFHAVPETGELYARWFQLGAFSPIFRSHGWVWREHVPWAHRPRVAAICREFAELLDRLPLLVRAGAILPLGPVVQHTGERPLDEITLRIFPPVRPDAASRFELYEDDGRSLDYRQGRYALTVFECATGPGGVTVRIGEPTGDRSVVPASRPYRLELARGPRPGAVTGDRPGRLPRRGAPAPSAPGRGGGSPRGPPAAPPPQPR